MIVFTGYVFMQFCRTLSENFKQLRIDIGIKSKQVRVRTDRILSYFNLQLNSIWQVKKRNVIYAEVIKRGLPRRYDRLHDNLEQMADVFDIVLLFEYLFYIMALLVRNWFLYQTNFLSTLWLFQRSRFICLFHPWSMGSRPQVFHGGWLDTLSWLYIICFECIR